MSEINLEKERGCRFTLLRQPLFLRILQRKKSNKKFGSIFEKNIAKIALICIQCINIIKPVKSVLLYNCEQNVSKIFAAKRAAKNFSGCLTESRRGCNCKLNHCSRNPSL